MEVAELVCKNVSIAMITFGMIIFVMSPIYGNRFIKCHYKMLLIFFLHIMILTFSKNVMLVVF
jgi:hypothetical protein